MSIQEQILRIEQDKIKIRNKMVELGKATNTDNLDVLADAVEDIQKRAGVTATVKEGETYTIPEGYHDGSGTVSGVAGGGNYSLQSKTVTPTKKQQSITSDDEYYGLADVVVEPIPDIYQDVTPVTAGAADVLTGKNIVDSKGAIVAGSMVNNGAVAKTLDTETTEYAVPVGYHNGLGKVSVVTEDKSVTPTKAEQKINATTGKVIKSVTVAPIPDAYQDVTPVTAGAEQVLEGSTIVDVTGAVVEGTMKNNGAVSKTLTTSDASYVVPEGFHNGEGAVQIVPEDKSVTPTKSAQNIVATSGKVLNKVSVAPIPAEYQVVTGVTAGAADVLAGKVIVNAEGTEITGSMPNNGDVTGTIDGLTTTSIEIPAGYTAGGTISLTGDIEAALAAI